MLQPRGFSARGICEDRPADAGPRFGSESELLGPQRRGQCICISMAGVRLDAAWLYRLLARGYEIYCGFDADQSGGTASHQMVACHPSIQRLRHLQHDWHDALTLIVLPSIDVVRILLIMVPARESPAVSEGSRHQSDGWVLRRLLPPLLRYFLRRFLLSLVFFEGMVSLRRRASSRQSPSLFPSPFLDGTRARRAVGAVVWRG